MRNKTKTRKSLNSKQMVQYQVIWHVYLFFRFKQSTAKPCSAEPVVSCIHKCLRCSVRKQRMVPGLMVLAGLCMWNVITKYSKYGRYPKFWNHVPKKNWLHKIKKMLTVAEFSWFAIIVKPCFDQKITFEIEKSKKNWAAFPPPYWSGFWTNCGNTKWHMAFLWKHKMAHGLFV